MRWESNRSSPHYKRRTQCVNHYTKHPHDQEVDYFNIIYISKLLSGYGRLRFYGVTCCQTILYYSNFPNDKLHIKRLVIRSITSPTTLLIIDVLGCIYMVG